MRKFSVLVTGGYGIFGKRLVERLAAIPNLVIYIAGRSSKAAQELALSLAPTSRAQLCPVSMDATTLELAYFLSTTRVDAVVHTAGPFQSQQYTVAEACIYAGAHYIDLSDGREFVAGISKLNERALERQLLVVSGASSVPALSGAVVADLSREMESLEAIDIGITTANQNERGLATVRAVLGYCGKRIPAAPGEVYAWCGSVKHTYSAPIGERMLSPVDVPDLALFPDHFPGHPKVSFSAGLELPLLQKGMNVMAKARRLGLAPNWALAAKPLNAISNLFKRYGSGCGAMHVEVLGRKGDQSVVKRWELIAQNLQGPYVPTLAATILIKKLVEGSLPVRGAMPCLGLVSLAEFEQATQGLAISMHALH